MGDPSVDRRHRIIRHTHCIFPSSWTDALLPSFRRSTQFVDPHALLQSFHRSKQCVWFIKAGYPFISSHPLATLPELEPLFHTNSSFGYDATYGGVLLTRCLHSSSTVSSHHDQLYLEIHPEAFINRVWTYIWRLRSSKVGDAPGGSDQGIDLKDVIERVSTYIWTLRSSEFGDALGGHDREIQLEDVIERVWRCTSRP